MKQLRKHWFDMAGVLTVLACLYVYFNLNGLTTAQVILWINLVSLFAHQFEEYRFPGYFPGFINSVFFKSNLPDRYPLNTRSAFVINVIFGWTSYLLAALFANTMIWLGIIVISISLGNFIAHTFIFNIRGRLFYNPGMVTSVLLFLPVSFLYLDYLIDNDIATSADWIFGLSVGIVFNGVGIFKLIRWMADKETTFVFEERQIRPNDRETK
jgi:hypothetical protein